MRFRKILAFTLLPLCLAIVFLATPACAAADSNPLNKATVIIGDSNTLGLQNTCSEVKQATVIARNGATVDECVRRNSNNYVYDTSTPMYDMIQALRSGSFDKVVINLGTNNLGSVSATYKSKYSTLLSTLFGKNGKATVYICKILPVGATTSYASYNTNENVNRLNVILTELYDSFRRQGYDVRLLDLNTPMKDSSGALLNTYNSGDGIHLSRTGYLKMFEVLKTGVRAAGFSDLLATAWYYNDVIWAIDNGIMTGIASNQFGANNNMTRAMFATALYRLEGSPAWSKGGNAFYDVGPGAWYYDAVNWAYANGIVTGMTSTEFWPNAFLTREQMAVMAYRYVNMAGVSAGSVGSATLPGFSDRNQVADYALTSLGWAVNRGVLLGMGNNQIAPKAISTRAQMASVVRRVHSLVS